MKYLEQRFTITPPNTDQYRDNFDAIDWGNKPKPVHECYECGTAAGVQEVVCRHDEDTCSEWYCFTCYESLLTEP